MIMETSIGLAYFSDRLSRKMNRNSPTAPPAISFTQSPRSIFSVFRNKDVIQKRTHPPIRRIGVTALESIYSGTKALTTGILTAQNIVAINMHALPQRKFPFDGLPTAAEALPKSLPLAILYELAFGVGVTVDEYLLGVPSLIISESVFITIRHYISMSAFSFPYTWKSNARYAFSNYLF